MGGGGCSATKLSAKPVSGCSVFALEVGRARSRTGAGAGAGSSCSSSAAALSSCEVIKVTVAFRTL